MARPADFGRVAARSRRPAILGHRGAPLEAPENTLAGLRRAVELGLDGVAYDLRACASGELALLADPGLERTSDAAGPLAERTLTELFGVDAGGWFERRFAGEPLALLDEALELEGDAAGEVPWHLALLREPGTTAALARAVRGLQERLPILAASHLRSVCLEARDRGLAAMLVVEDLSDEVFGFARSEGMAAVAAPIRAWRAEGEREWSCARWSLRVDDPQDLLWACRRPLDGLTTAAGRRALALRSLAALEPDLAAGHPLSAPLLPVRPGGLGQGQAQWCGSWELSAGIANPLDRPVRVGVEVVVRRGTFEAEELPPSLELAPGERVVLPFRLTGGSWSPGGDPLLVAHFRWDDHEGTERRLLLDAPLRRVREATLAGGAMRLELLREHPGDPAASMTLRRHGQVLLLSIESAGGLDDPRALAHLDGRDYAGGSGLRLPLPAGADLRPGGLAFSAGLAGRTPGLGTRGPRVRRWAGGVPSEGDEGTPGVLRTRG